MSDWEDSTPSPEAGQQAFHEAITPVQSSPSASEPDDEDFDEFAPRDTRPEVEEDSSSGEDAPSAPVESATQPIDNSPDPEGEEQTGERAFGYADAEDSASNDADKPSSAASEKDESVNRDDHRGETPSKEDISDDEEKDEDARQELENCGSRFDSA